MATLKQVEPEEVVGKLLNPMTLSQGNFGIIQVQARWKTWFGWATVQYLDDMPFDSFMKTPTYQYAVDLATLDLNNRLQATFSQLQDLII